MYAKKAVPLHSEMFQRHHIFLVGVVCYLCACTPHSVREAQSVVAQADSLWLAGQSYADSAQLAQAYSTLHSWRSVYPDEYAHACYHYGRLLRAQDDPVAAMECFINATHSRTDDNHILGRVYSNMGDLCHMASEFSLAYDMYEHCADMYLWNGDTLLYYHGLYRMAFEKAMSADKDAVFALTERINSEVDSYDFQIKNLETKSELYICTQQYDSALINATELCKLDTNNALGILIKAQSYSFLGNKDSATYYANMLLKISQNISDIHNALYILTNDDESKSKEAIRETASDRSDIQMKLKARQGKLSQAVQLLEQDLNRKPNLWWMYSILTTLSVVGISIIIYVYRKRRQHALLAQKLELLQQTTTTIQNKNEKLTECYAQNHKQILEDINKKCSMLQDTVKIKKTLAWKDYNKMCIIVDKQFYLLASKLRSKQFLNETEVRLCILTLLDCGYDQMAELLFRSSSSIGTLKMRVAKKFGTSSKQLRQYLIENECIR